MQKLNCFSQISHRGVIMFSLIRLTLRHTSLLKFVSVKETTNQRLPFNSRCFKTLLNNWNRNRERDAQQLSSSSLKGKDASQEEMDGKPKILLLDMDNKRVGSMTLLDAQRLAKKKELKLIKLDDPVRQYKQDVYQLLTGIQLHQEKMRQRAAKKNTEDNVNKGDKTLIIGSKITPHDLQVKIKTVKKWLQQNHPIRVTLHNDASDSAEKTFTELEKGTLEAGGRTLQKRKASDGSTIKCTFQLDKKKEQLPPSS